MTLTPENRMYVAAHRGDSYNYYENTMTAFKNAAEKQLPNAEDYK